MAIYHLSAKIVSRGAGRSVVNAAAYRRGLALQDERLRETFSYTRKSDVLHSELTAPPSAPAWVGGLLTLHESDAARAVTQLWNHVERHEKRGDAQLAREVEIALPTELALEQNIELVREFVRDQLAARGMIADWSIHGGKGSNPHAHILLTMRPLTESGFGARKQAMTDPASGEALRDSRGRLRYGFGDPWGSKSDLLALRERWAEHQNVHLARHGFDERVDHRSFKAQGVELTPTSHLGVHAQGMQARGMAPARLLFLEQERAENARKIAERPDHVLDILTRHRAVFSWQDVERTIARYVPDASLAGAVGASIRLSPELLKLADEERTETGWLLRPGRFTTRTMLDLERRMGTTAETMASVKAHSPDLGHVAAALHARPELSEEQVAAVRHVTAPWLLSCVVGFAGTGKSTTLAVAREAWERAGFRVRGVALAGKAADGLASAAGIRSQTIHSLERSWARGLETLSGRDVLVVDEAGMVGSAQLARVLDHALAHRAKVVLVGDAGQLQPIEAGAAFRAVTERVGSVEIATVRRQRQDWAREASLALATGKVERGLASYQTRGHVHLLAGRAEAKEALVDAWMAGRLDGSGTQDVILAHTNEDVADLNSMVRRARSLAGELGTDAPFPSTKGERHFASGDRVVFLQNDRVLGVRNGTLGTVTLAEPGRIQASLDGGAAVNVYSSTYAAVDHGYAITIHKAQGVTVERAYVLASGGLDRHLTYVAMTRHRERVDLLAGRDDFPDAAGLVRRLGRERPKETTLDFAERRGIDTIRDFVRNARAWLERGREQLRALLARLEAAATIRRPVQEARPTELPGACSPVQPVAIRQDLASLPPGRGHVAGLEARALAEWKALVDKEAKEVRSQAEQASRMVLRQLERLDAQAARHRSAYPRAPGAAASLFGAKSRHEQALQAWKASAAVQAGRRAQLEKRLGFFKVRGAATVHPAEAQWPRLAEARALATAPELAHRATLALDPRGLQSSARLDAFPTRQAVLERVLSPGRGR